MKTIIQTEIKGDNWVATTPHAPSLKGEAAKESEAINALVAEIRRQIREAGDKGIEWKADAKAETGDDKITRQVSGCWPPIIKDETPARPAKRKDVSNG